jgi:phenylalanyl-tRNA synthetase beta chain
VETYRDLTSYPALVEDISVKLARNTPVQAVKEAIAAGGGPLLVSVDLFDVYEGEELGEGNRALAFRLTFRADDRTLTLEDVSDSRGQILAELLKVGGSLRG